MTRIIESADSTLDATVMEGKKKVYSDLSDNLYEKIAYLTIKAKDTGDAVSFSLSDTGSLGHKYCYCR